MDQARYVVTVPWDDLLLVTARLRTARVPMRVIGLTGGDALAITGERAIPVPTLSERFESWLPAYMAGNLQN